MYIRLKLKPYSEDTAVKLLGVLKYMSVSLEFDLIPKEEVLSC